MVKEMAGRRGSEVGRFRIHKMVATRSRANVVSTNE